MTDAWMVRAGHGGHLASEFESRECVAIGWSHLGDLTCVQSQDDLRQKVDATYSESKVGNRIISTSTIWKIRKIIEEGDTVITYDPARREYLIGTVSCPYRFDPKSLPEQPHQRRVQWTARVSRDELSLAARNTLGSTVTVFKPGPAVMAELTRLASAGNQPRPAAILAEPGESEDAEDLDTIREDVVARSHEFIKDRLLGLSPEEMESMVASLLRAMGYKARVTPKGPDRGRDVVASPDGLGFQQPRIVAEVKHRPKEPMGSDKIRSFLGGLRDGEAGLYVSTGGFTREAEYEAVRAKHPITLVRLDDLADLIVEHYDQFDPDGRARLPLMRVYWPAW